LLTRGTAGFYNTIDFGGETGDFLSIMPLHDETQRMDGGFPAGPVTEE
jgi:hypothetical protein